MREERIGDCRLILGAIVCGGAERAVRGSSPQGFPIGCPTCSRFGGGRFRPVARRAQGGLPLWLDARASEVFDRVPSMSKSRNRWRREIFRLGSAGEPRQCATPPHAEGNRNSAPACGGETIRRRYGRPFRNHICKANSAACCVCHDTRWQLSGQHERQTNRVFDKSARCLMWF